MTAEEELAYWKQKEDEFRRAREEARQGEGPRPDRPASADPGVG